VSEFYELPSVIRCVAGREWNQLTGQSKTAFAKKRFTISVHRDRMGCRLSGVALKRKGKHELLSTAVDTGTIQVLPNGQLIVLMADHQTTGGYPRIAHVISPDWPKFAQCGIHDTISFQFVSLEKAEGIAEKLQRSLQKLQASAKIRLQEFL
jgi:antagonist of KipI